jgi:hypothetical protein
MSRLTGSGASRCFAGKRRELSGEAVALGPSQQIEAVAWTGDGSVLTVSTNV